MRGRTIVPRVARAPKTRCGARHSTFRLLRVSTEQRPDLAARFAIATIPTLLVIDGSRVSGRLAAPRGCEQMETFLAPWLR